MRKMTSLSLGIIILAVGGLVLTLALPVLISEVGLLVQAMALGLTAIVKQRGPLRQVSLSEPEDEREEAWHDRANLNAFGAVSIIAMIGIGGFAMSMMFDFLHGRSVSPLYVGMALFAFAMFLFVLFMVLPTLFAGWSIPEAIEDEPEKEERQAAYRRGCL